MRLTKKDKAEIADLMAQLNRLPRISMQEGRDSNPCYVINEGHVVVGNSLMLIDDLVFRCRDCGNVEGMVIVDSKCLRLQACPRCGGREVQIANRQGEQE